MVFSGKPSTACHACRKTRSHCDRVQTGCSQCIRKRMICPGYRATNELRIRNDTVRVTHKAQQKQQGLKYEPIKPAIYSPHAHSRVPICSTSGTFIERDSLELTTQRGLYSPGPHSGLTQSAEQAALAYFMNSYILTSPYELYLPELFSQSLLVNGTVPVAVRAVAFMALSIRTRMNRYSDLGQRQYVIALARVNTALSIIETAITDDTLASVLLLGLFESVSCRDIRSLANWTAHTAGTVELLRMRGKQQFRNKLSRQLFMQAGNNIRASCIQRAVPIPSNLMHLTKDLGKSLNSGESNLRLVLLIDRVAYLRVKCVQSGLRGIIDEAMELDQEATALIQETGDKSPYSKAFEETTQHSKPVIRKYWIAVCMVRLFLNDAIWRVMASADEQSTQIPDEPPKTHNCDMACNASLQSSALKNIEGIASELLQSVPMFLEQEFQGPDSQPQKFSPSARVLLWPLRILLRCSTCPLSTREKTITILKKIEMDLNLSGATTDALPQCWLHLYYLG